MNQEWGGTAASPGGREGSVSPSKGQEMGKRVWRGVNSELLAAKSQVPSPRAALGPAGSHTGHGLSPNLCSPDCTLSSAAPLLLLGGGASFFLLSAQPSYSGLGPALMP